MKFSTLYKRSTTGKIVEWTIEIFEDSFRTTSGYTDGLKVTSEWTKCTPKNIGKKNQTTGKEQAILEAKSKWDKRRELGFFQDIKDIDTPIFFQPMLANKWEKYKDKIKYPIYSQPKLDGIRCIVKSDGMWSRNGKQILSAPHIFNSLEPLFEEYPELILDGELYADRNECDFEKIISLVRKTVDITLIDYLESKEFIQYHIYDCASHEGDFTDRYSYLAHDLTINNYEHIVLVETYLINSNKDVEIMYNDYVTRGFEGQMLRLNKPYENKRTNSLLKHKSWMDDEFTITEVIEGKGKLSQKVGKLRFEEGFDAAVNGSHEYLAELWIKRHTLIGKKATVKYFEITGKSEVPRFGKVIAIRDYE